MNITEATAKELIAALNRNSKALEAGTKPPKPLWVKIGEIHKYTIWKNKDDYDKARRMGWVNYRIVNGKKEYDIHSISQQFKAGSKN